MDDLTVLRDFRAEAPWPSAAQTSEAMGRLADQIDQHGSRRAFAATVARRGAFGSRRWGPVGAAASVLAVAAATVAVTGLVGGQHRPVSPRLSAAGLTLHAAASAAARQPAGHGRFFVTESEFIDPGNGQDHPALRRIWVGNGLRGRLMIGTSAPDAVDPGIPFGRRTLTWRQLRQLPTDPARLLPEIAKASRHSGYPLVSTEFGVIADLLFEEPAPPALRGALYAVAAKLPTVTLIRRARDLIGRQATEVLMPSGPRGGGSEALFIRPSTGAVLGISYLASAQAACPPVWEAAVLATAYVSSDRRLPRGAPRSVQPATRPTGRAPGCPNPESGPTPTPVPSRSGPVASPTPVPSRSGPVASPTPVPSRSGPVASPTPVPSRSGHVSSPTPTPAPSGPPYG